MKKISLSFFLLICLTSFSQITKTEGTIIGEILVGEQHSYIISESGTSNYYKSSVCSTILPNSSVVTLVYTEREDGMIDVRNDISNEIILAKLLNTENGVINTEILSELPSVLNEMLVFRNEDHLTRFYDLVDLSVSSASDSSAEMNEKLAEIEDLFNGFVSYRKYFDDKYFVGDKAFTESEIASLENEDFISNEVLKSLFNSYRIIGIGDSIYYYNDMDEIVSFSDEDIAILNDIKVLSRAKDIEKVSIFDISSGLMTKDLVVLTSKKKKKLPKSVIAINLDYSYHSIPVPYHLVESCNPFKKGIQIQLNEVYHPNQAYADQTYTAYNFNGAGASLFINWGDGNSQTVSNYDGSFIYHTYTGSQTYSVSTILTFVDLYGITRQMYDGENYGTAILFNTETACSELDAAQYASSSSGNWKMTTKIWVNHNIFGHHIGAYTHSWKWVSGEWKRRDSRIHVSINATFRNDECEVTETKTDSKTHNNDRRIETVKTKLFRKYKNVGIHDVKSNHTLQEGGTTITINMELDPC